MHNFDALFVNAVNDRTLDTLGAKIGVLHGPFPASFSLIFVLFEQVLVNNNLILEGEHADQLTAI